jgi:glycosyltransferase involved in cell wall biosynthesis
MEKNQFSYEIIFIDDGSTDGTWDQIQSITCSSELMSVRGIQLSRHQGKNWAQAIGLRETTPAIGPVVLMDSDGQHDPQLIPDAVAKSLASGTCQIAKRYDYKRRMTSRIGLWSLAYLGKAVNVPMALDLGEFVVLTPESANELANSPDLGLLPLIPLVQQACPSFRVFDAPVAARLDGTQGSRWTVDQLWHKAFLHLLVDPWKLLPRLALIAFVVFALLGAYGLFVGVVSIVQAEFLGVGSVLVALIISVGLLTILQIMTLGVLVVFLRQLTIRQKLGAREFMDD